MIAIVCPGQGAQTPGFLLPWLADNWFQQSLESMQVASGLDLVGYGTTADADAIRDTAVAQPLIVAAGVSALTSILQSRTAAQSGIAGIAGHSVGEITAAVGAGVFTAEQGISFVAKRGQAMATAAALEPTSMAAILGGEIELIEATLKALDLEPANYNGAGQIVAAGSVSAIQELQANPPAGSRVIPLQVAGAFHTRFMRPAVSVMQDFSSSFTVADPAIRLWSNAGGVEVKSGQEFLKMLVSQVASPVRWDLCMASMLAAGITAVIEVAPAGTLVGLAKRAMPGIETLAVKTPDNLEAARTLISNHVNLG